MEIRKLFVFIGLVCALVLANAGCSHRQVTAQPPVERNPHPITAQVPPAPKASPPESKPAPAIVPPAPVAKPDPVADVIAASEKEYAAGQENVKAGNADAAKANFDRALTILAESAQQEDEVQPDPRLQEESVRIHQALNDLNLQTAKPAEAAPEQKAEPAPIDEANEVTPPVDPNIKAQAAAEIKATHSDLPLMLTDPVAGYINYFSNRGRGTLEHALVRSGRYQEMIRKTLKDEGVPQDLIYLAQAESGFHPLALSRVGARGIWQFMAETGKLYGLRIDSWLDERRDPIKATDAAARHLEDLTQRFGSHYLAAAAYNAGAGRVGRGLVRMSSHGSSEQDSVDVTSDEAFFSLADTRTIRDETKNYVPQLIAAAIIAKEPAKYGFDVSRHVPPFSRDSVVVDGGTGLDLIARLADTTLDALRDLNPHLLRLVTPPDQRYAVRVPTGTAERVASAYTATPPDERHAIATHQVQRGETVVALARRYGASADLIRDANRAARGKALAPGTTLYIPVSTTIPASFLREPEPTRMTRTVTRTYVVRAGEGITAVARRAGVSVATLRSENHLGVNARLGAGRRLTVRHTVNVVARHPHRSRSAPPRAPVHVSGATAVRTQAPAGGGTDR